MYTGRFDETDSSVGCLGQVSRLVFCTREIPGQNIRQEAEYGCWGYAWFSSAHMDKCRLGNSN